ncbi:hypothetical protein [Asaia prunellae]|uniref:hypothetical protein n=1 Tax=Asaia prunellae TaxID=610245 RepID=UPI000B339EF7|nr:hypothetical protein [Asaia prunellae]
MKITKLEGAAIAGGIATVAAAAESAITSGSSDAIRAVILAAVTAIIKIIAAFKTPKAT